MALQAHHIRRLDAIRALLAVPWTSWQLKQVTPRVYISALDEIVALHAVLVGGAVREMGERLFAQFVLFQFPEILQIQSDVEPDRPVVVFAVDRIGQRLPLRMALDAGIVGMRRIRAVPGFTIFVREARATCSLPGPWHLSHPTFHSVTVLVVDVVIHRMAAVAERARRALHVVGRIEWRPPVGAVRGRIRPPQSGA